MAMVSKPSAYEAESIYVRCAAAEPEAVIGAPASEPLVGGPPGPRAAGLRRPAWPRGAGRI